MKQLLPSADFNRYLAKKRHILFMPVFVCILLMLAFLPGYSQYCTPGATNACTTNNGNETISNFKLGTINNNSACSPVNYEDFFNTVAPTTLTSPSSGVPYSITALHADFSSPYSVAIWIDLDSNGVFDANERVALRAQATDCPFTLQTFGMCPNVVRSGTLDIPPGVTTGFKRLRVRMIYQNNTIDPCNIINYGESEDYKVYITGSVPVNDITVGTITPLTYCAGASISIPYTATGSYTIGNFFTAELSDANGNFSSPVTIGTLASTTSGTIAGTIPANATLGTGYKIRVNASAPATTGTVSSASITINPAAPVDVTIQASPGGSVCPGTIVTYTATPTNGGNAPQYQWLVNGSPAGTNQATYTSGSLNNNDVVSVALTSNAVCATGSPDTSNSITVSLSSAVEAGNLTALADTLCSGGQISLTSTGSNSPLQWQSSTNGSTFTDISGVTDTTYTELATQSLYYRVYTLNGGNCADTSTVVQVVVNATPAPAVLQASDSIICSSDSTEICATGGPFASYQWNNGATTACIYAKAAGGYFLTATSANGCSTSSSRANLAIYPVSSVSIVVQGDTLASFGASSYQWYVNNSPIQGATGNVHIATQSGNYQVEITDNNGCISRSSVVAVTVIGINDPQLSQQLDIFPNPASGSFNIRYTGNSKGTFTLSLFNILGEKIQENRLNFVQQGQIVPVDVSLLPKGSYLVKLRNSAGETTKTLVIQ